MTSTDALKLGAFLALVWPEQALSEPSLLAWHGAGLADVELGYAVEAAKMIARNSPHRPSLAEILEVAHGVSKRARDERLQLNEPPGVPPPAEVRAELERLGIAVPASATNEAPA